MVLFMWGALSDERTGLPFVYAAALTSAVFLGSESLGTRNHILLSQIWDFPFRRLLRLAGSRWRYSTPPPHGLRTQKSKSKSHCDWRSVSQSASLSVKPNLGLMTRLLIRLLCFWALSMVMFLFKTHRHFGDWILSPSSGKKPTDLGPIDRASPCPRTPASQSQSYGGLPPVSSSWRRAMLL
jgi:hypothetical protein